MPVSETADVAGMLFVLANAGDSYGRIIGELETWHADRGARNPQRTAMLQARVLVLLVVNEYSRDVIAERVGISRSSIRRHVRDLEAVFPPLGEWLKERRKPEMTHASG